MVFQPVTQNRFLEIKINFVEISSKSISYLFIKIYLRFNARIFLPRPELAIYEDSNCLQYEIHLPDYNVQVESLTLALKNKKTLAAPIYPLD